MSLNVSVVSATAWKVCYCGAACPRTAAPAWRRKPSSVDHAPFDL